MNKIYCIKSNPVSLGVKLGVSLKIATWWFEEYSASVVSRSCSCMCAKNGYSIGPGGPNFLVASRQFTSVNTFAVRSSAI